MNANVCAQTHRDHAATFAAGIDWVFSSRHSCDLVWMRNTMLDRAIQQGFDWLFSQDADVFSRAPQGPLIELIKTATETDATICSPLHTLRMNPPRANAWPVKIGEVYEAEKVGSGMILLNLNKMREWYFDYQGPCFFRTYDTDKGVKQAVGLDIFFSYVVRQHGGKIIIDGRIPTTHVDACYRHEFDPDAAASAVAEPSSDY